MVEKEYSQMVAEGELQHPSASPISQADAEHYRRSLLHEMRQDPLAMRMLEGATGVTAEEMLDDVMQQIADLRSRKP